MKLDLVLLLIDWMDTTCWGMLPPEPTTSGDPYSAVSTAQVLYTC